MLRQAAGKLRHTVHHRLADASALLLRRCGSVKKDRLPNIQRVKTRRRIERDEADRPAGFFIRFNTPAFLPENQLILQDSLVE